MCAERVRPGLALIPAMLVGLASGCAQPLAPTSTTPPGAVVPIDQRAALADAERRWASWRLQNYDFLAYSPCFLCRLPSRVRFEVRNGAGRAVDVDAATARMFESRATIDLLFADIHRLLDHPAYRFEATYHPTYGYPVDYFVDLEELLQDDVGGVTIEEFVVR